MAASRPQLWTKGAPRSERGGQYSCSFSLRPGSGAIRKGSVSPRCLVPLGPHSPGLRYLPLPHVTSCCCFILGLSQGHGGLTSFLGTGPDFWVLRPYLLIPPFILAAPMGPCPCSAPAMAGLAVAVSQGTAGCWGAGEERSYDGGLGAVVRIGRLGELWAPFLPTWEARTLEW